MSEEKNNRWLVKNKRIRAENHFNSVMCEYIKYKYGEIAIEFCKFYDQLMAKQPVKDHKTYKGAKAFKTWVSDQIAEYCKENTQLELPLLTNDDIENILQGLKNGQDLQQQRDVHTLQALPLLTDDDIENILQGLKNGQDQQQHDVHTLQELPLQQHDEHALQELPLLTDDDVHTLQELPLQQHDEHALQELPLLTDDDIENILQGLKNGQDLQSHADDELENGQDLQQHADNEIEDVIRELENGGVDLDTSADDEGIHLDLYEEIVGDISDFDFEKECDDDDIFW